MTDVPEGEGYVEAVDGADPRGGGADVSGAGYVGEGITPTDQGTGEGYVSETDGAHVDDAGRDRSGEGYVTEEQP